MATSKAKTSLGDWAFGVAVLACLLGMVTLWAFGSWLLFWLFGNRPDLMTYLVATGIVSGVLALAGAVYVVKVLSVDDHVRIDTMPPGLHLNGHDVPLAHTEDEANPEQAKTTA